MNISFVEFLAEDFDRIFREDPGVFNFFRALEGRRLYISGATGFFGKNLLALLSWLYFEYGVYFEVEALSRFPGEFLKGHSWAGELPFVTWLAGDMRHPWPSFGNCDMLLHAAADTTPRSTDAWNEEFDNIVMGTQMALDFCARKKVKRLLVVGSGSQYGVILQDENGRGVADGGGYSPPSHHESAYSKGKNESEILVDLFCKVMGVSAVYARCFSFVGPGLSLERHFAIGNFIRNALDKEPIRLNSTGRSMRSYLYSADLAVWLLVALVAAPDGARINVGSDKGLSLLDLAEKIRVITCLDTEVAPSLIDSQQERSFYLPRIDQARKMGLKVWTPLENAIGRTMVWANLSRAG